MKRPALTLEKLDAILDGNTKRVSNDRILWTLPTIAKRIGVGVDFVRDTLAKQPGSPIRLIGSRYYAFDEELMEFMRSGGQTR